MIGAILLGLVAGIIGRALVPGDVFQGLRGPRSWLISMVLGLVGALVGYAIFTLGLGIGDDDVFDLGGLVGAIVGVVLVLVLVGYAAERSGRRRVRRWAGGRRFR